MEVHLDAEARLMGQKKRKEKRRRPTGCVASSSSVVSEQTGRLLAELEHEWLRPSNKTLLSSGAWHAIRSASPPALCTGGITHGLTPSVR